MKENNLHSTMDYMQNPHPNLDDLTTFINAGISHYLKQFKNGDMLSKVYKLKCMGMTQKEIAKECNITTSSVFNYLTRIRYILKQMKANNIILPQFEMFATKQHNDSQKTLPLSEETQNSEKLRKPITQTQQRTKKFYVE